MPDPASD